MDFITAKQKAIKYIGISKKTEFEVRNKLKNLGASSLVIAEVIEYIKELSYIDDVAYSKSFIKTCEREGKKSIYEIKLKLLQKGIKEYIIDENLEYLYDIDYEEEVIDRLSKTKFLGKDDEKIKYLCKKGFRGYNESEMYL